MKANREEFIRVKKIRLMKEWAIVGPTKALHESIPDSFVREYHFMMMKKTLPISSQMGMRPLRSDEGGETGRQPSIRSTLDR